MLVFAPHSDDEVFGCGGALALHAARGDSVTVIVLTDGAAGGDDPVGDAALMAIREAESCAAADVMGLPAPQFWRLPDCGLDYGEALITRIMAAIKSYQADLVYAPSPCETHADHRATALATIDAVRRLGGNRQLMLYEISAPQRPNLLLDISPALVTKRAAMCCFASQLARHAHDQSIEALNRYRTFTLPPDVLAAEAYELCTASGLANGQLNLVASEYARLQACGVTVAGPDDAPLVSVLIRSIGRDTLGQALDSVALQTWRNIEVIVVNAFGDAHPWLPAQCGDFALRLIDVGTPLRRSAAANHALSAAHGELALFLDDDDWLLPDHVARLVAALRHDAKVVAAYAGVRGVSTDDDKTKVFDQPYARPRLLAGNFIPIHAVLFRLSTVREHGLSLDEELDLYEDWDFWLQLSHQGGFVHVPGVSACYRLDNRSGLGLRPEMTEATQVTNRLLDRHRAFWHDDDLPNLMEFIRQLEAQWQSALAERDALVTERDALVTERDALVTERDALVTERDALVNSTSWRITRPVRTVGARVAMVRWYGNNAKVLFRQSGGFKGSLNKALLVYRHEGFKGLLWRCRRDLFNHHAAMATTNYPGSAPMDAAERADAERRFGALEETPEIALIMPVYNPEPLWLDAAIRSVRAQVYQHWRLCIADDASTDTRIRSVLKRHAAEDIRVRLVFREANGHISAASNSALTLADGCDWIGFIDHDDTLTEDALLWVAEAIGAYPKAKLFYSDEDKIDGYGQSHSPYFKCNWNQELFRGHNLVTHLAVYEGSKLRLLGGLREGFEGAQDYDLALRFIEELPLECICHIPRVLYHWRVHPHSTAGNSDAKPYAMRAGERALNEHLARTEPGAHAELIGHGFRVHYPLPDPAPKVTILIPTRNGLEITKRCIESILDKTTYPNYDITLIDNGSDDEECLAWLAEINCHAQVRVSRDDRPFNYSALNNAAAREADGELLVLLNNDMEVITPGWLNELASHALRPDVGAVGAMLYFPNDTIQHAGIVLGIGGWAGHSHKGFPRNHPGYVGRLSLASEFSAVTGACLVTRRALFNELGGLNETELAVACNDVDYCLRLRKAGYRVVFTPFAELYHHESVTRGYEDTPEKQARFARELAYMRERWGDWLDNDPAYSPNLTLEREDFSIAARPRPSPLSPVHTSTKATV
ncbi:MAG: glycosyltransferase [Gammaproteobacteria bacterium SHHR-1]